MTIMSENRQLRIRLGYGLERQVPDAIARRIIHEVIAPQVQAATATGPSFLDCVPASCGAQLHIKPKEKSSLPQRLDLILHTALCFKLGDER